MNKKQISTQETARAHTYTVGHRAAPPAKNPADMDQRDLAEIVRSLQTFLYLTSDEHGELWSVDHEVSGADFIDHAGSVLQGHGLTPTEEESEGADNVTRYLESDGHWVLE